MKAYSSVLLLICSIVVFSCSRDNDEQVVEIPKFDYPETITFETNLSSYNVYQGTPAELVPSSDFHLYELSAVLFTDFAYKQRLVKLPAGVTMKKSSTGKIDFPNGTILVKTFYYFKDERDTTLGKNIIETRLLIKENETWNIATYQWNEQQSEATLAISGADKQLSWINKNGNTRSTLYHLPSQNECITCHQSTSVMTPIGPTVRNLNRNVQRNGSTQNQLDYLHSAGLLENLSAANELNIVDYKNVSIGLEDRARAYLDMNCSHCHNPTGWEESSQRDFDFRYETPLSSTGIEQGKSRIQMAIINGEMPFIGTTVIDHEGINLLLAYLNEL